MFLRQLWKTHLEVPNPRYAQAPRHYSQRTEYRARSLVATPNLCVRCSTAYVFGSPTLSAPATAVYIGSEDHSFYVRRTPLLLLAKVVTSLSCFGRRNWVFDVVIRYRFYLLFKKYILFTHVRTDP
jgi:hypothetical protein